MHKGDYIVQEARWHLLRESVIEHFMMSGGTGFEPITSPTWDNIDMQRSCEKTMHCNLFR